MKSKVFAKEEDPIIQAVIGEGLLMANGDRWKAARDVLGNFFGHRAVSQWFPTIRSVADEVDQYLGNLGADSVDPLPICTRAALVVLSRSFGHPLAAVDNPRDPVAVAVATMLHETEERIFQLIPFWRLPNPFSASNSFRTAKDSLAKILKSLLSEAKSHPPSDDDELTLLQRVASTNWTTEHQIDQLLTLLIAGHGNCFAVTHSRNDSFVNRQCVTFTRSPLSCSTEIA